MVFYSVLLLLLTVAIGFTKSGEAVSVVLEGSSTANVDGTFIYTCTVRDAQNAVVQQFKWFHNGREIVSQVDPASRVTIMRSGGDPKTSIFTVTSIQRDDGGDYYCKAIFSNMVPESMASENRSLTIQGVFSVEAENHEYEVILDSRVELRCRVDAVPTSIIVRWIRVVNDEEIPVKRQNLVSRNVAVLERNITLMDNGVWRCRASNVAGGDMDDFLVTVLVPPSNTTIPQPSTNAVRKGENLELNCSASGNRPPTFTWIHNGVNNLTAMSQRPDSRVEVNGVTGYLLVRGVTYGDAGTYTCIASNKAGTHSSNIAITVEGSPEILIPPSTQVKRAIRSVDFKLNCPYISNPLPSSMEWSKGGNPVLPNSDNRYRVIETDGALSLHISKVQLDDVAVYTCTIRNQIGHDFREIHLVVADIPGPPANFRVTPLGSDSRAVQLTWNAFPDVNQSKVVEGYVLEQSINGGGFHRSGQTFEANVTSAVLRELLPGETYVFRLRASNVAGLSEPSAMETYTPPSATPLLSFFNATALEGGRSVLLTWQLQYRGAPGLNFTVEIVLDNVVVRTIRVQDITLGSHDIVVMGLNHEARYVFSASLVNTAGLSASYTGEATTTIAPPSRPTKPDIMSKTTNSIRISFYVEFGTQPITYFLLNVTQTETGSELQKRFGLDERKYIDSLTEKRDRQGVVIGYTVAMFVTGLRERTMYEFEVAAASSIGVGEFSEPSEGTRLEDDLIIYYIIAGVVSGVLLVVILIVVVAIFAYGKQRYNQRKKTFSINSNGNHPFPQEDLDGDLPFKSDTPSVNRQFSRDTLTSVGNGHFHMSTSKPEPYDRSNIIPSPPYNRLGESPLPSGTASPIGIKTDSVSDVQVGSGTHVIQTYFTGGKVVHNPQYNLHVPGQQSESPRPQHVQLKLQTSLSDIQHYTNSPTPDRYPESLTSDKPFLSDSHLLSVHTPIISRSNPTIGNRYQCDSMLLPGPKSQATDV